MMKGNSYNDCPHLKNAKMLIEVVKGNSMGEVDNFTGVLNRLAGSEAISMIFVWLSYISTKYTLTSNSLSGNPYILNQRGTP
jgi:hypothetical protein